MGERNNASIYSVAQAADTSVGTVSNVINHPERVSPALRTRVEAEMARQRYWPRPAARALARQRSRLVGVVVFDISNPFFSHVANLMDQEVQAAGNSLMLAGTQQSNQAERAALESMSRAGVDAFAVCTSGGSFDLLNRLQERGHPVLLFAQRSEDERIRAVTIDDFAGMGLIAGHVVDRGAHRICFIEEPVHAVQHRDRWAGFVAALDSRGLDPDQVRRVPAAGPTWDGGFQVVSEILAQPRSTWPDCIVCLNDYTAIGACRAVRSAGLVVGRDILVTGYDDIPYGAVLDVPLTTIRQPFGEMSVYLTTQLLEAAERRDVAVEGRLFKPELMIRESA